MAGQSPRTRTPGPDPKPGNADPDPARNSKRNRTPELDRLLLESSEFSRRSLRNQAPSEPEIGRGGGDGGDESRARKRVAKGVTWTEDLKEVNGSSCFVGDPVPEEEAKRRWPHRYENKVMLLVFCVEHHIFNLHNESHFLMRLVFVDLMLAC